MNNNSLFRKASLDRVTSPEQLDDYIKVTRPSVWLVLGAVIVLLIGICFWGVFGTLTTSREVVAIVQEGKTTCYVTPELAMKLTPGMELVISGVGEKNYEGKISSISSSPIEITEDFDSYALYLSGIEAGDWLIPVTVDVSIQDGVYIAKIILETISPISFLLN